MKQGKSPDQLYRIASLRKLPIVSTQSNVTFKWRDPRHLYSQVDGMAVCPKCRKRLDESTTFIPIGMSKSVRVSGQRCLSCDRLYIPNSDDVFAILQDNLFAKDFTLNGYSYNSESVRWLRNKRLAALRRIADAVMMICIEWEDDIEPKEAQYIIVSREHPEHSGQQTLFYASPLARELLTAAIYEQRRKKGSINGRGYDVTDVVLAQTDDKGMFGVIVPKTLFIQPDGGYASSIKNRNYEIVDLLLYSPKTQCYEIIKATYSSLNEICYSDIWLYRTFVKEYGRPDAKLDFIKSGFSLSTGTWDELSEESILKSYGYNVAADNGLSSRQRQELLAEIVDLDILSVAEVVRRLKFFIDSHPSDKDVIPRAKWTEDWEFIKRYKVNPERFFIAKDVRRK